MFTAKANEYAELAETQRRVFELEARKWYQADAEARAAWRPLERALVLLAERADRDAGELHDRGAPGHDSDAQRRDEHDQVRSVRQPGASRARDRVALKGQSPTALGAGSRSPPPMELGVGPAVAYV